MKRSSLFYFVALVFFVRITCNCALAQNINTVAGNSGYGYSGDGGPATAAELYAALGAAFDNAGNLYIADESNVIRKVNTSGIISTVAGNGYGFGAFTGGYTGDGGPATAAELYYPDGVAVDASGNIYIDDQVNNVIRKVNTAGIIGTIAGNGYGAGSLGGYSGDGGPATDAELDFPAGIALDNAGNLYIADQGNDCIRKVNTSGIISTIAAGFDAPAGVTVDNSGNLYIADWGNNVVRELNTSGVISTIAGNGYGGGIPGAGSGGYSGDGGAATLAELFHPTGISVDASGNVYIADNGNFVIRKVNASGIISTYAGNGTQGYSGDGGPATNAELEYPSGVALDNSGRLYIADDHDVREIGTIIVAPDVCIGDTATFRDVMPGGTWSSSTPAVATINASTGLVTGVSAGVTTITYTLSGYYSTVAFNVVHPPAAIMGPLTVCSGAATNLGDIITGGTWSSSTSSIAYVDAGAGIVSGVSAGTVEITYATAVGCFVNTLVTVIPGPTPITGIPGLCLGMTTALSDGITGGSWSSSSTAIAAVGSATGIVTGASVGAATISYTLSSGCTDTEIIYVSIPAVAGTITGPDNVCVGSTVTLSDAVTGGHWNSASGGSIAFANFLSGTVTGVWAGSDIIYYTVTNSCSTATVSIPFTVAPLADTGIITGPSVICVGDSITVTDAAPGGAWNSGSPAVAIVTGAGIVYGIVAGTADIIYTVTNSCGSIHANFPVTVLSDAACSVLGAAATKSAPARLTVFPNPNDGIFSINVLSAIDEQAQIVITNMAGEKVMEFTMPVNKIVSVTIKPALGSGMYLLSATTNSGKFVAKVTVQ